MKIHRSSFISGVTVILILFLSVDSKAQIISYCDDPLGEKFYSPPANAIGQQDNNILIWHYDWEKHTLQLNFLSDGMRLLKKVSLKVNENDGVYKLSFFRKNNCNQLLMQYRIKNQMILQRYDYDAEKNSIIPLAIVDKSNFIVQTTVAYSSNAKYTGLIQAYNTNDDSTLIRYLVFDDQSSPVNNITFLLPYKYAAFDFSESLVDNNGNLIFYTNSNSDTFSTQAITIYEVNLEKDSLLVNDFFKKGGFANIRIQQNRATENINVSGILLNADINNNKTINDNSAYLFVLQLDKSLTAQSEMTLFSISKIIDSLYPAQSRINSIDVILNKDSGYNFYITGITDYKTEFRETNTGRPYIPPPDFALYKNNLITSNVAFAPNAFLNNSRGGNFFSPSVPGGNAIPPGVAKFLTATIFGNNFFTRVSVSKFGTLTINNLKYKTEEKTFPEYEYVMNTEQEIHYLFSRVLKRNKQSVSDIIFNNNNPPLTKLVLTNPKYALLLHNAVQVSSSSIIVPYLKLNGTSFAKIDFK